MTGSIFRYGLSRGLTRLPIDDSDRILAVRMVDGIVSLYALVDAKCPDPTGRSFVVYATGEEVSEGDHHTRIYVDTVVTMTTPNMVWHVFEEIGPARDA